MGQGQARQLEFKLVIEQQIKIQRARAVLLGAQAAKALLQIKQRLQQLSGSPASAMKAASTVAAGSPRLAPSAT